MAKLRQKVLVDDLEFYASKLDVSELLSADDLARLESMQANGVDHTEFLATLDAVHREVPDEAWDTVPTDLSINLDHYLYGARKRNIR